MENFMRRNLLIEQKVQLSVILYLIMKNRLVLNLTQYFWLKLTNLSKTSNSLFLSWITVQEGNFSTY
jgi:hypothetical protein